MKTSEKTKLLQILLLKPNVTIYHLHHREFEALKIIFEINLSLKAKDYN